MKQAMTIGLYVLLVTLSPRMVISQSVPFQRDVTPFVVIDPHGSLYAQPFTGGINRPLPQFVDIDGDGDLDLFLRDRANQLVFYENAGSPTVPSLIWVTDNYAGIPIGGWFRFVDIDNDGDVDLFVDSPLSNIAYYRNEGSPSQPLFVFKEDTLRDDTGTEIFVESPTVPDFRDIDCDGAPELFLGRISGEITQYAYTGLDVRGVPVFEYVTDTFQGLLIVTGGDDCTMAEVINDGTGRHGACSMTFVDIDADGDPDLFWGDFFAQSLLFLENSGTCPSPVLTLTNEQYPVANPVCTGGFNIPAFADIDGDGDIDFFVGTQGGAYSLTVDLADNLSFYENIGTPTTPEFTRRTERYIRAIDIGDKSIPAAADIDGDGDIDFLLANEAQPEHDVSSRLHLFRNDGTAADPVLVHADTNFLALDIGYNYAPTFVDIDADNDQDLIMGEWTGNLILIMNNGTSAVPQFVLTDENYAGIDIGNNSKPAFVDIDNDGDQDLFIGEFLGNLNFYRNVGTPQSAQFEFVVDAYFGIDVDLYCAPWFADIDHDGDYDLFVGSDLDGVLFYRNIGTPEEADFVPDTDISIPLHFRPVPLFVDIDGDQDEDLFLGVDGGGMIFYRNDEFMTSVGQPPAADLPDVLQLVRAYPNPFNPRTTIEFRLGKAAQVAIEIYDVGGRSVDLLPVERYEAGLRHVEWNAAGKPSGVYLARVSAGGSVQTVKLVLLR